MEKIALVGEAWGKIEEMDRKPFVGPAGIALWSVLKQLGRTREDFTILNVMNERPPNNDFGVYYEDKGRKTPTSKLADAYVRINEEIRGHNVVIALGAEPMRALTGDRQIEKWRGSILSSWLGVKVIPTWHPSNLVRGGRTKDGVPIRPVMLFDFKKAFKEASSPKLIYKKRDRIINPNFPQVISFLKDILGKDKPVVVDIETGMGEITCIGTATSPTNSFCIPYVNDIGRVWNITEEMHINKLLKEVLAKLPIIGQNFSYDMAWLDEAIGKTNNYVFDTLVAMNVTFPELPQSLAFQTSILTDIPYYKDDRKGGKGNIKDYFKLWNYCCNDTLSTYESYEKLGNEIDYRKLHELFLFEMEVTREMYKISRRGIKFDTTKRNKMKAEARKELKKLEEDLNAKVGKEINPKSPKQLQDYFYGELGIAVIKHNKTKRPTLDENAIKKLQVKYPTLKSLDILASHRRLQKFYGTYLGVTLDSDKHIRCSYGWTETGRLTSSDTPHRTGTNLQNIPKHKGGDRYRALFIPKDSHKFVEVDLSQAEARVVAYDSMDEAYMSLFESGGDIHKENASKIFSIETNKVTNEKRQLGKKIAHATNYGMGPRTLCESIIKELGTEYAIREADAKVFQRNYFEAYPGVRRWHEKIKEQMKENRTLTNCMGRERIFLGPWGDSLFKEAYAFKPQSTVADIINTGILNWAESTRGLPILLQVHDSVLMEVPEDQDMEQLVAFIKGAFEFPFEINGFEVTIPIDIKEGKDWQSMKEI